MKEVRSSLLELQTLDADIVRAEQKVAEFGPRLESLEQPLRTLETELESTRTKLTDLRQSVRRLESAAEQKRDRLRQYEARMERVRNMREESAARMEMDLIRGATEADETEALEAMEQATRTDLKVDDLIRQLEARRAEVAPQREALLEERRQAEDELAALRDRRLNQTVRLDPQVLRMYERVRTGRTRLVVAPLTSEGACGNCYNTLPLQQQSEIRREDALIRCEQCGVILYVEDE
jgi:uncharacterized protein